ncbi:hypothetical protein [Streptomyces sp. NBC_00829]|uniref:hypothetical protein n=1 Tax=Streptomyces sp. NBC_00829 TaxID=2903679 RepID=UPI0038637A3A|nr:hypothetical protein OG293_16935 [Streptomyces sp. NBC_00829]
MAAHAAVSPGHHVSAEWAVPVSLGFVYGIYAAFLHHTWGDLNWGDVFYGIVGGLVLAALCFGLGRVQEMLPRELRAAAYGTLTGIAVGFLKSLTGDSILSSAGLGLIFAAAMTLSSFYLFYMHEA